MKILIIDDSATDCVTLSRLIELQGHIAVAITNFQQLADVTLHEFDLALVDLWLTALDPEATLEEAKKLPIPFVAITGDCSPDLARKIGRLGLPLLNKSRMNFSEITHHALGLAEAAKERRDLLEEVRNLKIFKDNPAEPH